MRDILYLDIKSKSKNLNNSFNLIKLKYKNIIKTQNNNYNKKILLNKINKYKSSKNRLKSPIINRNKYSNANISPVNKSKKHINSKSNSNNNDKSNNSIILKNNILNKSNNNINKSYNNLNNRKTLIWRRAKMLKIILYQFNLMNIHY